MPTIQFCAGYYLRIASQWNVIYIFHKDGNRGILFVSQLTAEIVMVSIIKASIVGWGVWLTYLLQIQANGHFWNSLASENKDVKWDSHQEDQKGKSLTLVVGKEFLQWSELCFVKSQFSPLSLAPAATHLAEKSTSLWSALLFSLSLLSCIIGFIQIHEDEVGNKDKQFQS